MNYVKDQCNELEEESRLKQDNMTRLTYELSMVRKDHDDRVEASQNQEVTLSRLTNELNNYRKKYSELEE